LIETILIISFVVELMSSTSEEDGTNSKMTMFLVNSDQYPHLVLFK
jgi:hypothetical protein